jgi:hypothetical protein
MTIENSILLGDTPPRDVEKICTIYRRIATKHRKWKLDDIAGSVYEVANFVCNREKVIREHGGQARQINTKVQALVTMYDYFVTVIDWQEGEQQSRIEKARKSMLKTHAVRPLPSNFKYDKTMVCIYYYIVYLNKSSISAIMFRRWFMLLLLLS